MSEPMTEAEQAVVDVLEGDSACTWHVGCDVEDCYGPRAAAIVAKLRPILAAEALREEAAALEEALAASAEPTMFVVPAHLWLRDRAALRTTTSDEEDR
jgi:hypothetical protein